MKAYEIITEDGKVIYAKSDYSQSLLTILSVLATLSIKGVATKSIEVDSVLEEHYNIIIRK